MNEMRFQRVFSKSMYKNLQLPLAHMTFTKDFVSDRRGDLYPVISADDVSAEWVENNRYTVKDSTVERMFTRFFPFATYRLSFADLEGSCGFVFHLGEEKAALLCGNGRLFFSDGRRTEEATPKNVTDLEDLVVSCRPKAFDVYRTQNGKSEHLHTFYSEAFANSNEQKLLARGFVSVNVRGSAVIDGVSAYIDCGISQADIRPVCFENGEVIYENGRVHFTASVRMHEGAFQGIFSWVPSTERIEMTGAVFFDCGDGLWRNYLASSLLFDRVAKTWRIWTSSFEHKHILAFASFDGDVRYGVNVIDVQLMRDATEQDKSTDFVGFRGDEDPDFYYNEQDKKWYMAICRVCPETKKYRYCFFSSDRPFDGYTFIGQGLEGAETGGAFVRLGDETAFICGNDFHKRADYRMYTKDGMREAKFDFDDGGFRGWGGVMTLCMGSRKRYFWLTFDRHNGSAYNWSYGNIYCFEGIASE